SANKEAASLIVIGHGHPAAQSFHCRVRRRIDLMFTGESQADAAVDQQRAKQVENPVEAVDQTDSGKDEKAAHQEGTENSPKQHAALVLFGHGEIPEDYEEEKKIVHAEGKFEDVAGDEFN